MISVLIASAGTGGHIFPAVALGDALKSLEADLRVIFVRAGRARFDDSGGSRAGETRWVPGVGMPRGLSPKLLTFGFQTLRSLLRSLKIIRECRPDIVVGFGNFGSYGPVRAAAGKRIPIFLHEANAVPGKANRVLAKHAACIGLNFANAAASFPGKRVEIVGMPIREEFKLPRDRAKAAGYFGLDKDKLTVLVTGGSQGARHINETVCGTLPKLRPLDIQVIHLTGEEDVESVRAAYASSGLKYCVKSFEARMKHAFDAADIVISRAGASSIAEITATGTPALLVPYPFATEGHQFFNAKYLFGLNTDQTRRITDEKKRRDMSTAAGKLSIADSAETMAGIVLEMAGKREEK